MARDFNNSDPDDITITGLLGEPATVTMACWVDVDSLDNGDTRAEILSMGDVVTIRTWNDTMRAHHFDGSYQETAGGGDLRGAGWTHVAFAVDPGNSDEALYKNGSSVGTSADSTAISYSKGSNTTIGKHGNGSTTQDLDGRFAEVAFWNRRLSADEIAALADGFSPLFFGSGLLFYAPLVRDVVDFAGNTVTDNGTTAAAHPPNIVYPTAPPVMFAPATSATTHERGVSLGAGFAIVNGRLVTFGRGLSADAGFAVDNERLATFGREMSAGVGFSFSPGVQRVLQRALALASGFAGDFAKQRIIHAAVSMAFGADAAFTKNIIATLSRALSEGVGFDAALVASVRMLWERVGDDEDTWTKLAESLDTWTRASEASDDWAKPSESPDTWTRGTENDDDWSD